VGPLRPFRVSPDDRWIAVLDADDEIMLYPIEGGEPRRVPGTLPGDELSSWAEGGGGLFVSRFVGMPVQVFRVDLDSGVRSPALELAPRDAAGIGRVFACVLTRDGKGYVYTYVRKLDTLYLMTGVD
jgi:hypothetical protein